MSSAPTAQNLNLTIRWMIRRDMPEVLLIEQESFERLWTEDDFIRCLRQRNCIGMVAEYEERVVGFMIYELLKNRIRILNFAVAPSFRRKGVGRQMAEKLKARLSATRTSISIEIPRNSIFAELAIYFFGTMGFEPLPPRTPPDAWLLKRFFIDTLGCASRNFYWPKAPQHMTLVYPPET